MTKPNIVPALAIMSLILLMTESSPVSAFERDSIPPGTQITAQNWRPGNIRTSSAIRRRQASTR